MLTNLLTRFSALQTPIATVLLAVAALFLLFDPILLLKGLIALIAVGLGWDATKWIVASLFSGSGDDDNDDPDNSDFDPRHPVHAAGFATTMN